MWELAACDSEFPNGHPGAVVAIYVDRLNTRPAYYLRPKRNIFDAS